ncbi:hypothetical protein C2E20_7700 [Micractinium conductrix]|uniref:Uncharacterized protein n=1 Tax=Micractinium conductrix TaxID=554055 RepID=A0A2P6V3J1_9CHLO|nr:hypothetical protein C2E20_7700 [Micractinium conductrix]|eukprot:PSC68661.1 hypothetical protein C2E20_7700 [Micractinium conductrix]
MRKPRRTTPGRSESPNREARGRGGRRRWCTGQNIALLLTATLVSAWVWGDGPQPRPDRSELQLSPATAGARATLYSSDGGDVALLAVDSASAEALLAAARPEAVARAAARNRRAASGGDPAGVQPGEGGVAAEQHAALREQVAGGADANAGGGTNAASEAAQQQLGEQAAQEQAEEEQLWKIEEEPLSEEGQAGGAAKDVAAAGAAASQLGAAPAAATGPCNNSMVVVLTSHKTGTAQTGCIVEMLEQRYVPQGAARHDHHPDSLHAVAQFAAQRLPTSFSGGIGRAGSTYCPSVKFYSSGHHLPRLEDEGCPGTLPCPCKGEQEQCLAVDAGTIDIPPGNTTVVQVIRQPINVILSAYQYHTQEHVPEGEEWLQEMTMGNFSGWMYSGGVPYEALDALGAHDSPQESYYSFLRRLEPDLGVKLQFWFSSWELYGFARQYASLAVQPGITFLPVRFEDLQDAYNTTVRGMLLAFKERLPAIDVDWLLGDTGEPQLQACHISRWNPKHRAEHRWEHVTSNKNPELRKRLRGVLMADSEIAPRLCQLSAMFGYDPDPECGALEGEGDADGGGGGATDDDLLP